MRNREPQIANAITSLLIVCGCILPTAVLTAQDSPKFQSSQQRTVLTRISTNDSTGAKPTQLSRGLKSKGSQSGELKSSSVKKSQDQDQDMILGSKSFAMDRYGQNGETIDSSEVHLIEFGKVDSLRESSLGTTRLKGQTRIGEARARTYSDRLDLKNGDSSASIGAEAQANLIRADYGVTNKSRSQAIGGVKVQQQQKASVDAFVGGHAQSQASVNLSSDPEVSARAGVFAGAKVDASASNTTTVLGASSTQSARGYAAAGAGADAGVGLNKQGVSADAGAFAGAKAGANGSVEVAGVEGGGNAEAWAGVGARAKADAGYDAGKVSVSLGAGAAVGVGGSVDTELTIDVAKTVHDVKQIDRNTGKWIESGSQQAQARFESASRKVKTTALTAPFRSSDPGVRKPQVQLPAIKKPEIKPPTIKQPVVKKPSFKKPKIKKPKIKSPFKKR